VPSRLRIFGAPVSFASELRARHQFSRDAMERWKARYGIDFAALVATRRDPTEAIFLVREDAPRWQLVAEPALLADIDLTRVDEVVVDASADEVVVDASADEVVVDASADVAMPSAARVDGAILFFEAVLGPQLSHSTDPRRAPADNHWRWPAWMLEEPLDLDAGDRATLRYRYRAAGSRGMSVERVR
jgi:hypothetical protein